ncbi:MAG: uncharacterized protein QOG42_2031, partial [Solirubrobacteraceae bacterium]|nr:uncharacterized protein [Solirubrobacteraceae bacterium]
MPEYLAPGVFVEEVSFRAKSIEGVATSTTGFAGMTRYGPVRYAHGPEPVEPRLITSFAEYERVFGGLEALFAGGAERVNYMAHAARAFFLNGGQRLYVARVFDPPAAGDGVARHTVAAGLTWAARWPGKAGEVLVDVQATRSRNVSVVENGVVRAQGAKHGSLVEVLAAAPPATAKDDDPLDAATLAVVTVDADNRQTFHGVAVANTSFLRLVDLRVIVQTSAETTDVYDGLSAHPQHKRALTRILQLDDPADENAAVWLDWNPVAADENAMAALVTAAAVALQAGPAVRLQGGLDG